MDKSEREIVTEKVVSTVRMLEGLEFDYCVSGPKQKRKSGNQYDRVVTISLGNGDVLAFYNHATGRTWASGKDGPVPEVKSIEGLETYLKKVRRR